MNISFQKLFYIVASVIGMFAILILAGEALIPIAFAFLVAFILYPVAKKLESWGTSEIVSALLSITGMFLIIGGAAYLFSTQIIQLSENLSNFKEKILNIFADATVFINKDIGFFPHLEKDELLEKFKSWITESSGALLSQTFSSTANIVFGILSAIIYTFLILIYKKGIVRAMVSFYAPDNRDRARKMFKNVQQVGQQYLFGMIIIVLILGFMNSLGLWIIGIDSPFLFGFLAAVLAIIPYVGTFLGSSIPILYALISYDSIWMPISIAILFWFVQFFEGNFLTPKIVGGNLKLNAFSSILSIIVGASVWGIAGMILFLPFTAMLKVVCDEYTELKPFAMLMGERNYETKDEDDKHIGKWIKKRRHRYSKYIPTFRKK
ncbi:MAG: AI-2E family transporter [Candidatus Kapabacteria bacterium]|nr:AI-2E family transporter [Candidatus Kapabacteria bacterium]